MTNFTYEESTLMCIYNTGSKQGLLDELTEMRSYLQPDEAALLVLTDSTIKKLESISDDEFNDLDLTLT